MLHLCCNLLDQGVIRCLKSHYRTMQVLKLIQNLDSNNQNSFTVFDAILMISEAWEKVSQKTIANCFRHAGFKDLPTVTSDYVTDDDEEDNISLFQLAQNLRPASSTTEADAFLNIDRSIVTCASATEDNIVQEVREVKEENDEQDDSEEQFTVPTLSDGLNAVCVLRKIVLFYEQFHLQGNYNNKLIKLQRELQNVYTRQ
ncbi:major centromere autoantigen B-like [Vanessa atalanta]|uniref:major centromere autoantigen B-like n=1 Tax=Vanessa atalanta TaxID=42275 RepID=UPI001FCD7661|nr:major centromere autoantigen B-like [Vanessa atalanta]